MKYIINIPKYSIKKNKSSIIFKALIIIVIPLIWPTTIKGIIVIIKAVIKHINIAYRACGYLR
jgi:hypothetical protein